MVLGVAGLGFILLRNLNSRKKEFALLLATGFTESRIRSIIMKDHIFILGWGLITGTISALITTWPSVAGGSSIPWVLFLGMLLAEILVGYSVIYLPLKSISRSALITAIRKE
jgi:ABC-type antimicrobial peptide transport system permease subunit